jgi:hypothetical protein
MWTPRTQAVKEGEKPFIFGIDSVYECTWFCYYEALWHSLSAPCWYEGSGSKGYGSYTDAKDWLKCYRDPWQPITDPNYKPVRGDILVYDGEHGHVIFMETDVMTAEYRSGKPDSFRNAKIGDYKGKLLGVLHYPYQPINPVERNENVNQIETTDESLRIRTEPSLNGEIVGHVQLGYYNVLSQRENDGYTWYEIAKDRWCANITVNYLPSGKDDIIEQIERYFNDMKQQVNGLKEQNSKMKKSFKEVYEISKEWAE